MKAGFFFRVENLEIAGDYKKENESITVSLVKGNNRQRSLSTWSPSGPIWSTFCILYYLILSSQQQRGIGIVSTFRRENSEIGLNI